MKSNKTIYTNGYSDGSGKGTIVKHNGDTKTPILRTHWGCTCCDSGATEKDVIFADKIVKILNSMEKK